MSARIDFRGIERQLGEISRKLDRPFQDMDERRRHEKNIKQQTSLVKWTAILVIVTSVIAFGTIYTAYIGIIASSHQEQKDTTVLFPGTAQYTGDNSITIPLLNQYSTSNRAVIECINIETTELKLYPPLVGETGEITGLPLEIFSSVNVSSCGQYTNINITTFPNGTSPGLLKKEFYYNYLSVDSDKPTNLEIYWHQSEFGALRNYMPNYF